MCKKLTGSHEDEHEKPRTQRKKATKAQKMHFGADNMPLFQQIEHKIKRRKTDEKSDAKSNVWSEESEWSKKGRVHQGDGQRGNI